MIRPEVTCDPLGVRALVVRARHAEAHREGLDRPVGEPRHERRHAARIDAAREEGAERDVAQQAAADGVAEKLPHRLDVALLRPCRSRLRGHLPVDPLDDPRGARLEQGARPEPHDVAEDRLPVRVVLEGEVGPERLGADRAADRRILEESLQLRGEDEPAAGDRVVERLLAEAVTVEEETPAAVVP